MLAHVPFGGAGWAMVSVVGEHTPIGFSSPAAALPHIRDGKLRALAVTSKTRSDTLPKVPTMTEAGYPASLGDSWVGVLVPNGTPKHVVTLLNRGDHCGRRHGGALERSALTRSAARLNNFPSASRSRWKPGVMYRRGRYQD